jgi:L-threonylcarbamoyladenylate synthase
VDIPLLAGLGPEGEADPRVTVRVARAWLAGGLVGLPTETVYGLAADAQDPAAVARIFRAKGRPVDHPLIVHVQGARALEGWSAGPDPVARRLAERFWPGALTLVVRRGARASDVITGGQDTVALRCPNHPVALACLRALARESGDPARGVAAPSANRFGRVSPTRAVDVLGEVGDALDPARDLVVDGGPCAIGVESTIVDCTADPPRVLRLGAISQADIDAALDRGQGPVAGGGPTAGANRVRAPGTLESHYAPAARVLLVEPATLGDPPRADLLVGVLGDVRLAGPVGLIAASVVGTPPGWTRLMAAGSDAEFARGLYASLRRADELGLATVVAVLPEGSGGPLAVAVRDRLARAAHGG